VLDEHPVRAGRGDRVVAVGPHGLLREPAQELGGVGRLAARLGERLAHLADDQVRDVVQALGHGVERAPQDLSARSRRLRGPRLGRRGRGVHGRDAVLRRGGQDRVDDGLVRRVEHGKAGAVGSDKHGLTV
jgi:hypothetical protein